MTVEHLMAALRGMGIDNAVVELDAGEIPGRRQRADFVELVCKAGIIKQGVPRRYLRLKNPVWVSRN